MVGEFVDPDVVVVVGDEVADGADGHQFLVGAFGTEEARGDVTEVCVVCMEGQVAFRAGEAGRVDQEIELFTSGKG